MNEQIIQLEKVVNLEKTLVVNDVKNFILVIHDLLNGGPPLEETLRRIRIKNNQLITRLATLNLTEKHLEELCQKLQQNN